ncbi:MAG: SH3 domain-containing protein [Desulfobacterales bacterium]|nr:SH3 domain-containing protein [Desulfobacterales bacterium]
MALSFGFYGCATIEVAKPPPPAPRQKLPIYYYVGVSELNLKETPDKGSKDKALVKLNEKVEKTEGAPGGWFLVSTDDGRSGWATSKYLELKPVTNLYVSKNGICLRAAPDGKSEEVCNLKVNDQVKILDPRPQNWVQVSVERTKAKGWIEVKNLAKSPVTFSHYRKRSGKEKAKQEAEKEAPQDKPAQAPKSSKPSAPEAL